MNSNFSETQPNLVIVKTSNAIYAKFSNRISKFSSISYHSYIRSCSQNGKVEENSFLP